MYPDTTISVSELNRLARQALERTLPLCWVDGEVSNFNRATSGHWYFTLKDRSASVRCVMFRNRNQFVDWLPSEGEHVEVRAQATLYEGRGDFQLAVEAMRHAGQGALFEAFLRLKSKLEAQGLFDSIRKHGLPRLPRSIGIITSAQAAGLHDVLTTLNRRWPAATVILYPCSVQGDQAPRQIIAALEIAQQRKECDVLLMVRGGGSLEDLKAFNDESLAMAMAACPIPIVAGIGHETDFSIADFVADLRAPTPTAAAQLATPDQHELAQRVMQLTTRLTHQWRRRFGTLVQTHDHLRRSLRHPTQSLEIARARLSQLGLRSRVYLGDALSRRAERLRAKVSSLSQMRLHKEGVNQRLRHTQDRHAQAARTQLMQLRLWLDRASTQLALLNPRGVLSRGYAIVRLQHQQQVIRAPAELHHGQIIDIELALGSVSASTILI